MADNEALEARIARLEQELVQVKSELHRTLSEPGHLEDTRFSAALEAAGADEKTQERAPELAGGSVSEKREENGGSLTWRLFPDSTLHGASSGQSPPWQVRASLSSLGDLRSGEWWLARLGIGLVLFGVVLLFGYSVQRGWLTPAVQVGIGLAVGFALIWTGLYTYEHRRAFSRVMLGGGVGALYITGFAAFQIYSLVPQILAFGFMVAVTLLSCTLSLRQDEASLSVIGALGGLGTPFLLYTGSGSITGLVVYVCLILSGTTAVYLYKNWASLLSVSSVGGWSALATGYALGLPSAKVGGASVLVSPEFVLQLGAGFTWLIFWLAPLTRELLSGSAPSSTPHLARHPARIVVQTHIALSPAIALAFTAAVWLPGLRELGWIALGGAVLYALAAYTLRSLASGVLARTHALVALLLFTLALSLLLRNEALYLALALEVASLHLVARKFPDRLVSATAHVLSCVVLVWLVLRLPPFAPDGLWGLGSGLPGVDLLVDLAVIALAMAASYSVASSGLRKGYRLVAHAALLLLIWRGLSIVPGGDGWVTVAWALYASGLFVAGLRLDRTWIIRVGIGTLFVVTGKLFVVDLASVDAFWRVVLFIGAGSLFLFLSYYLRALWRPGVGSGRGT